MYRIVPSLSLWIKFYSVTTECYWAVNFWFYCVKNFINKVIIFILLYLCYSRKYPYFLAEDFLPSPTASLEIPVLICASVEKIGSLRTTGLNFCSLLDLIIIKDLFFISMEKIIWCYHLNETPMRTLCMLLFTFSGFLVFFATTGSESE